MSNSRNGRIRNRAVTMGSIGEPTAADQWPSRHRADPRFTRELTRRLGPLHGRVVPPADLEEGRPVVENAIPLLIHRESGDWIFHHGGGGRGPGTGSLILAALHAFAVPLEYDETCAGPLRLYPGGYSSAPPLARREIRHAPTLSAAPDRWTFAAAHPDHFLASCW